MSQELLGFVAVLGFGDTVVHGFQGEPERPPQFQVVVDQENVHGCSLSRHRNGTKPTGKKHYLRLFP
jgi:hypothetical protein